MPENRWLHKVPGKMGRDTLLPKQGMDYSALDTMVLGATVRAVLKDDRVGGVPQSLFLPVHGTEEAG